MCIGSNIIFFYVLVHIAGPKFIGIKTCWFGLVLDLSFIGFLVLIIDPIWLGQVGSRVNLLIFGLLTSTLLANSNQVQVRV